MQNYALWWPVVGGLAFLTILILVIVLTGDHSPHSKIKQKRKKSKKRSCSRSPQDTTGHGLKKVSRNVQTSSNDAGGVDARLRLLTHTISA